MSFVYSFTHPPKLTDKCRNKKYFPEIINLQPNSNTVYKIIKYVLMEHNFLFYFVTNYWLVISYCLICSKLLPIRANLFFLSNQFVKPCGEHIFSQRNILILQSNLNELKSLTYFQATQTNSLTLFSLFHLQ